MKKVKLLLVILLSFILIEISSAEKLLQPYNLNFEYGVKSQIPDGWYMPLKFYNKGYQATINDQDFISGKKSLLITNIQQTEMTDYCNVFQSIDAGDFKDKIIKFKIALKTDFKDDTSLCKIWIATDLNDGSNGKIYQIDSINTKNEWKYYEVTGKIENNADLINIGITLYGKGLLFADDTYLDIISNVSDYNTNDNTNLKDYEINNLVAFSKIYGYIRYFYPSVEFLEFDWNRFLLTATETIENTPSDSLLITLKNIFNQIAPAVKFTQSNDINYQITKPKEALDSLSLAWLHVGAPLDINVSIFTNTLHNIYLPTRIREAPLIQVLDAKPFINKKITFKVWAKANLLKPDGKGQIWIGLENKEKRSINMITNTNNPIISNQWKQYEISETVPENSEVIRVAVVMFGDGEIYFDEPELIIDDENKNYIKNNGFEDNSKNNIINSWSMPNSAISAGYTPEIVTDTKYKGKQAVKISSDLSTRINLPKENEIFTKKITKDIFIHFPLTLFADYQSTLPKSDIRNFLFSKPKDFIYNAKDRYSRFSLVILLWNIQKHFAINVEHNINWDEILSETLYKVASIDNEEDLSLAINEMLVKINDGQARFWITDNSLIYALPILWKFIDDKLIVTQTKPEITDIQPGSEIVEINGKKLHQIIESNMKSIIGNTKQWQLLRLAAELRTNKDLNKNVRIKLVNPDGMIEEHILRYDIPVDEFNANVPNRFTIISEGFYYIDLTRYTEEGFQSLINEMKDKFKKAKFIIFDLRGFTDVKDKFLGMFTKANLDSYRK